MVLIASLMFSASVGAVKIPLKSIVDVIFGGGNSTDRMILLKLRLPRIIEAAFTGMGLSVGRYIFQGLLKNPMADPYVLGISSGAAFGASIAIVLGFGLFGLQFFAFAFALVTIYVVYILSKKDHMLKCRRCFLRGLP
jgi:iron complex transport system permease protein